MAKGGTTSENLLWALQERAKELSCLYDVEELLGDPKAPLDEVFSSAIKVIPPGWQYPDICVATIEYEGRLFKPDGFEQTSWRQSADIVVQDRAVGRVNVYYREARPQSDGGPFLKEEERLIATIADRLSHFILHQKLRSVFTDLRQAKAGLASQGMSEWRFALNLLRRTDQDLFVRISWKMANHLAWSGIQEVQGLLHGFGPRPGGDDSEFVGEKNQPIQKLPLDTSLALGDQVFELAASVLSDTEILERIQKWIHEDRSSFLVKTVVAVQSSPADILDAIRRYHHLVPEGTGLSQATDKAVRVNLIRRFLSDDLEYLKVAKEFIGLDDMLALLERVIYQPGSPCRLGGKSAGLILANQVLKKMAKTNPELGSPRIPKTWFIASDTALGFIRFNNLEEVYEQKYKDLDQVRLEYPHLVRLFQNSHFPPEIVKGLSMALDDLGDVPLIVRSSSLLEDRLGAAFSGKYKSLFLPNQGDKRVRLQALLDAVAEVYASIFAPDPIQYRAERGLLDFREEMGIMIQEVVGTRVGKYFFPAWAGVAVSNNEFRWSPRIKREDGLIRMVAGLGTRAVDRVGEDYPVLVAPGQPALRVNVTPAEVLRYSPQHMDVIDLERPCLTTVPVRQLLREAGTDFPAVHRVISVREGNRIARKPLVLLDFEKDDPVVTFEGLINDTSFVTQVSAILKVLQERLGQPVDIEFASDGQELFLLQCRPQSRGKSNVAAPIPKDVPAERILFTARRYVSNGRVPDITHIVYVDPDRYEALAEIGDLMAVGRAVSKLNALLPKRQFILMGPGRWGSRGDVKLGVNVTYSDINNTSMLIEIARTRGSYTADLSFGTHFFQDLVEASIRYLPLYPDDKDVVFNDRFFRSAANGLSLLLPEHEALSEVVRVIDVREATGGRVLRVLMNADLDEALGMLVEPSSASPEAEAEAVPAEEVRENHWRWRLRMAERLGTHLDGARFGVAGLYLIGSAKNATAGPASDIDLIVHFRGSSEQRQELERWFEGWSLCLDEMNYLRTGYRSGGLLDVHVVTDEDIAARSSYAVKIGAVTDAARKLPLKQ
jgi:pyruvate,water dikinase